MPAVMVGSGQRAGSGIACCARCRTCPGNPSPAQPGLFLKYSPFRTPAALVAIWPKHCKIALKARFHGWSRPLRDNSRNGGLAARFLLNSGPHITRSQQIQGHFTSQSSSSAKAPAMQRALRMLIIIARAALRRRIQLSEQTYQRFTQHPPCCRQYRLNQ